MNQPRDDDDEDFTPTPEETEERLDRSHEAVEDLRRRYETRC